MVSPNNKNLYNLEVEAEKKHKKREKKKKPKMRVSGAGVKELQKIIIRKKELSK